jgi:arginine exporter protein ArgO
VSLVGAASLGFGLGVVTGMPLGVINVAIVDAATARYPRYAVGLGLGGALADTVHATIAFLGIGRVITAHPASMRVLAVIAAIVIVGYAVVAWRRRHHVREVAGGSLAEGTAAGVVLTLPNPGALGAWAAIAAALWPSATFGEAVVLAIAVGAGSAIWFTMLARLVTRVRPDHPALRHVPRIALVLLVTIAGAGVIRAI